MINFSKLFGGPTPEPGILTDTLSGERISISDQNIGIRIDPILPGNYCSPSNFSLPAVPALDLFCVRTVSKGETTKLIVDGEKRRSLIATATAVR